MSNGFSIADIRKNFKISTLDESSVDKDPFVQFDKWFKEAVSSEIPEVNAMTIATSSKNGRPAARMVLMKQYDAKGIVFYTNYDSAKGSDITENPMAALLFFWEPLERQLRIVGSVEKISVAESFDYFRTRPIDSQLGAWASHQSNVLSSRSILEKAFGEMLEKFKNGEIPLPPRWGGYRVIPDQFEFWQGRENRLHDRVSYKMQSDHTWNIVRLSP